MSLATAIFAAGCFWGVQSAFDALPGVISTQVGYTGGYLSNPSYEMVSSGLSGHAEAIEVTYDPQKVNYDKLLDAFFANHNPTTLNRQGPDTGTQYRSAVFYGNEEQKVAALQKINDLEASHKYPNRIVTEVKPAGIFYPAEEYHQKYLQKRGRSSCSSNIPTDLKDKSNEAWQQELTAEQFRVLRQKGTERPHRGKYNLNFAEGTYKCAACGNPLFASDSKFETSCGWPSFDTALQGSVNFHEDNSLSIQRTEVTCAKCGGHLGHIFQDMPRANPNRYCINSVALDFEDK